jgi:hypothetical protein
MKPTRLLPALALGLVVIPASAQTPLFLDGTAFGGSKVFSEGTNPLGNPARFDQPQPQPAIYATYVDGDQRSKDSQTVFSDLGIGGSPVAVGADQLRRLADSPWALRTRGFGVAYLAKTGNTSFTHEDQHSFLATTDRDPLGSTRGDVRRSAVDRVAIGVGSMEQGVGMGFSLRIERWKLGTQNLYLNPVGSQLALSGGPNPFDFNDMPNKTTTLAVDFGFLYEFMPGIRFGGTVDRLNQKRLWDVRERPQVRLGAQVDLGTMARLGVEMDVNRVQRMPFPVEQSTTAVSLRIVASQSLSFVVGAERRKIGEVASLTAGASVQFRTPTFLVGAGFQFGQDRPLKGATMVVN